VHAQAVAELRSGGYLILETYTPRQLAFVTGMPLTKSLLIEPEQMRLELADLEPVALEEREHSIEEGPIASTRTPW
jgi:hypothetical protein